MKSSYLFCLILLGITACSQLTVRSKSSLSSAQGELISTTAEALLLLPDTPHERTKNRELSLLVELLIKSNDLERAEQYRKKITNWRATQLKANIALAYHKVGNHSRAEELIADVETIAETVEGIKGGTIFATGKYADYLEQYDDFRLDRVKVALAQYYWAKGEKDRAAEWSKGVLAAELADFIKQQAESLAAEDYEASLTINDILVRGETFEGKKVGIDGLVHLYSLYYADQEKRLELKNLIDEFSISQPVMYRIEWLHRMAISAYEQGDAETAKELYSKASLFISGSSFRPRLFFPLKALNIITAHKLELHEEAVEAAHLLYEEYNKVENSIYNIHRADVLCAVGEAFAHVGLTDRAEKVYLKALDQAGINPNSRPRLEDLKLITHSVIKFEVPLTPTLLDKIDELVSSLGEPW